MSSHQKNTRLGQFVEFVQLNPWDGLILLLFILAAFGMNYPLFLDPGTGVIHAYDPMLTSWILAWDCHQLIGGGGDFFDANIFWPKENALAYSEHLLGEALWVWPFYVVGATPAALNNLALWIAFTLNGFAAYLVSKWLFDHWGIALVAGFFYAYTPFRYCQMGHLQVQFVFWLPLLIYCLMGYLQTGKPAYSWGAAFFFWQQAWSNGYLFIYLLYPVIILMAVVVIPKILKKQYQVLAHGIPWVLIAIPLWWSIHPYLEVRRETGFSRSLGEMEYFSANIYSYFSAPKGNLLYGWLEWEGRRGGPGAYLFPGLAALGLMLMSGYTLFKRQEGRFANKKKSSYPIFSHRTRWVLWSLMILTVIFAFGPKIHLCSRPLMPGPMKIIADVMPGFDGLRANHRWHVITLALMFILVADGAVQLKRKLPKQFWTPAVFWAIVLICLEGYAGPFRVHNLHPSGKKAPSVNLWLDEIKEDFAVVEYPLKGRPVLQHRYQYYSAFDLKPRVNGTSGMAPPGYRDLLLLLEKPWTVQAQEWMTDHRVRYVIVHEGDLRKGQQTRQWFEELSKSDRLKLIKRFEKDSVWEVKTAN